MKYSYLLIAGLLFSCSPSNNPFQDVEPTTTDPVIRARELNDSAIDLFSQGERLGDAALDVFDQAIALDSNYDKPHINKIAVLMQLRRFNDAQKVTESLLSKRSTDPNLMALAGMLYRLDGDTANALIYMDLAVNTFKGQMNNLDSLGPVYQSHQSSMALLYWLMGNTEACEKYAPGMTSEERPEDASIAAQFWISVRPEETE